MCVERKAAPQHDFVQCSHSPTNIHSTERKTKNMKKYFIASAAALMAVLALSSCGETETADTSADITTVITDEPEVSVQDNSPADDAVSETEQTEAQTELSETEAPAEETVEDTVYSDNMSSYTYIVPADGSYTFKHSGEDDYPWNIYVRDEEFPDGIRYLYSNFEPDYVSDCTADLKKGQYVYLICTANEWTGDEAEDAQITVFYNGTDSIGESEAAEAADESITESSEEETTETSSEE